jgi:signal transduction histidine kinase
MGPFSMSTAMVGALLDALLLFAALLFLRRAPGAMAGLGWWAAALGVNAVRYFAFFLIPYIGEPIGTFLGESLQAISAVMLLVGALAHVGREPRIGPVAVGCLLPTVWTGAAVGLNAGWLTLTVPLYLFSGGVMILSGIIVGRSRERAWGAGRLLLAALLILWGLHKFDYPFLRPVEALAAWGYLLAHAFEVLLALVMILMAQRHLLVRAETELSRRIEAESHADRNRLALADSVDQLTQSNTELARIIRTLGHDFQEPLRNVITYSQLLSRRLGPSADPELREQADFITGAAMRLRLVVGNLTAYSRVSAEIRPFRPFKVEETLQTALMELDQQISTRRATVTNAPLPTVTGDANQIGLLLRLLLDNAIRYTPEETAPKIHVTAERDGLDWIFGIRDNASGIEQRHWNNVFEPGWKDQATGGQGGPGLGLAICRRIVERHGGRIWVEDSTPGRGSHIRFTLPAEPQTPLASLQATG